MKYLPPKVNSSLKYLACLIFIATIAVSCKNKGEGDTSWFSSGKTELGTSEEIQKILSSGESLRLFRKDSVLSFYSNRSHAPAWSEDNLREDLIETFKTADQEGLYFEDYNGDKIQEDLKNFKNLSDREKSNLDVMLTDSFFMFGEHLLNGRLDPKELHEIWDVPRNKVKMVDLLNSVIEKNDLQLALENLRPNHIIYKQLIASGKEYQKLSFENDAWEDIPFGEMIKPGKQDQRIPVIQERLRNLGYLKTSNPENTINTEDIQKAVETFQGENGLQADGIIGDTTIELLNIDYDERLEQVMVNLERWRWYPRDLGEHYIIVNIANFRLDVVKEGDTVHTHRTMVGTEARKTPVFSEEVEYIVFNPTWTIPPTIQNDDVIPGMRKNSGYLSRKNINVYDKSGNQLDPSSINWNADEAKSLTYMQNPGPGNPLGRVKIIYPNKYFIYLHDTPSQALFARNSRDQSSGCVRVENAVDLAKYLLDDQQEYSSDSVDKIIAKGDTKQIQMKQKVKVHHFYWTAWRENGATRFTADIYKYDSKIYNALRKAS